MSSAKGGYDEVEFLFSKPPDPFPCQFCGMELSKLKEEKRQAHYEDHLSDQGPRSASTSTPVQDPSSNEKNVFWRPSFNSTPPRNFTPNLIPLLKKGLIASHQTGATRKAALCHNKSVHVAVELWDFTWGCGYRNFLMACIALMEQTVQPGYAKLLKNPIPPGVENLQRWIEDAWDLGAPLDWSVIAGLMLEKGTMLKGQANFGDGYWEHTNGLALRACGKCDLVDFHTDKTNSAGEKVVRWVTTYFSPSLEGARTVNDVLSGAVTVTGRMPVVLQHAGHSRTVVGYEIQRNGECNLLVFDPSKQLPLPPHTTAPGLRDNIGTSSRTSRDKTLVDRIKDTMFHSINEIKARKRKGSPGVIDLTQPTQKRPRSVSGSDIVVDEPGESSHSRVADVESQPGRLLSVELDDDQSLAMGDVTKRVLSWSRLSTKRIRKNKYQILHFPLKDPLTDAEKLQRRAVTSLKL